MSRTLWIALAATVIAVIYVSGFEDAEPEPSVSSPHRRQVAAPERLRGTTPGVGDDLAWLDPPARVAAAGARNLFDARNFDPPPPPPPPVSAKPPPPQAPPLPFKYQGKLVEAGVATVFLVQGDRVVLARPGDTLGGLYRVETIQSGSVVFTYLPLDQRQTLATGSAN